MSSIQRSKSAPKSLSSAVETRMQLSIPRNASSAHFDGSIGSRGFKRLHSSSPLTPRFRQEDPFNLAGFFPVAAEEDDDWRWLHKDDEGRAVYDELKSVGDGENAKAAMLPVKEDDDDTGAEIAKEDKLGLFTLDGVFSAMRKVRVEGEDDILVSPYTVDESCNCDSLYLGHCKRRTEKKTLGQGRARADQNTYGLFFDGEEKAAGRWLTVL